MPELQLGRREFFFSYPLYFFSYSLLSSYLVDLFVLFQILLFPCASVQEKLLYEFISYDHTEWSFHFSLGEIVLAVA